MPGQVDICNRALLGIGARSTISSISPSDGSREANACSVFFQPVFEQVGRAAYWNCLRRQITLTLVQAATGTPENVSGTVFPQPDTPWLYGYQYPADALAIRFIVPSAPSAAGGVPPTTASVAAPTALPSQGRIPFQVATSIDSKGNALRIILTNQENAQVVYTRSLNDPNFWDSHFQEAVVQTLGGFLVPALSLNMQLLAAAMGSVEKMLAMARASDGNETVVSQDHQPDWIAARAGAAGLGWGYGTPSGTYYPYFPGGLYGDISWPVMG